eukprot:1142260-Pelagomonas_calceolata.AAC.8
MSTQLLERSNAGQKAAVVHAKISQVYGTTLSNTQQTITNKSVSPASLIPGGLQPVSRTTLGQASWNTTFH